MSCSFHRNSVLCFSIRLCLLRSCALTIPYRDPPHVSLILCDSKRPSKTFLLILTLNGSSLGKGLRDSSWARSWSLDCGRREEVGESVNGRVEDMGFFRLATLRRLRGLHQSKSILAMSPRRFPFHSLVIQQPFHPANSPAGATAVRAKEDKLRLLDCA